MRYLAVDYGEKRTGLAMCDAQEQIASPFAVLTGQGKLADRIAEIIDAEEAEAVVLGLPLNMDGSEGAAVKRLRKFASELGEKVDVEIFFHDERLSSFHAEGQFAGMDMTRNQKRRRLDAVAAAAILRDFLDKRHNSGP